MGLDDGQSAVGGAAIYHNMFDVRVVLGLDGLEGLGQGGGAIVGDGDQRDLRGGGQGGWGDGGLGEGWGFDQSSFNRLGGVAAVDGPGLKGLAGNAAEGEDGAATDGDARANGGPSGYPTTGFQVDGAEAEVEAGLAPVVVAGAQVNPLGEADIIFDGDGGEVVDPEVFAEPAMVANGESPGKFNPYPWLDIDALADLGAKAA